VFIYLDETGDLGFDFTKPKTTRFFVVTLLLVRDQAANVALRKAVERTLKNKLRRKKHDYPFELKGTHTTLAVKRYLYRQLQRADFRLYTLVVDKYLIHAHLRVAPARLYNYLARLILERCPFDEARESVTVIVDRSKGTQAQRHFNEYVTNQLLAHVPLQVPLRFDHVTSVESKGIQATDMFSWGIFRKYEVGDMDWYDVFQEKIGVEEVFPKIKARDP
jgi:hypothetical protein